MKKVISCSKFERYCSKFFAAIYPMRVHRGLNRVTVLVIQHRDILLTEAVNAYWCRHVTMQELSSSSIKVFWHSYAISNPNWVWMLEMILSAWYSTNGCFFANSVDIHTESPMENRHSTKSAYRSDVKSSNPWGGKYLWVY